MRGSASTRDLRDRDSGGVVGDRTQFQTGAVNGETE